MAKLEIALQKLIDKEGFYETKSMLGLTTMELIDKSNCRIDLTMANDILGYLFREKLFPWKYKNCQLSYDGFSGVINWECDWSGDFYDDYDTYTQKSTSYKKSNLAYSPNLVVGSTISARIIKNLETKVISKYVGLQYLDNTSRKDRSLDPFFVQDLQINYQFKMKDVKTIEMILQINNFWNRLYAPNGYTYSYIYNGEVSRNNYYFPMAGLNFMFGLNLNF
jgi:outer membrane receptor for ferrienterochelin and colicin